MTYQEVIKEYEITYEDILAVLDYADKTLSKEEIKLEGKMLKFVIDEDLPRFTGTCIKKI